MPNTPTTHGSVTHHGVGILKSYTPVSGGVTKVLLQWEDSCTRRCWFCLPMLNGIQKGSCLSCSGRGGGVLSSCKTDERADSGAPVWLGSLWQKQCLKSSRWKVPRSCPYPDFLMFSVEIFPSWGVVGWGIPNTEYLSYSKEKANTSDPSKEPLETQHVHKPVFGWYDIIRRESLFQRSSKEFWVKHHRVGVENWL